MVAKSIALLFSLLLLAAPAGAVFVQEEMDVIEPEPLFDSEYFLDLLGFAPPLEWEWEWHLAITTRPAAAYRINGASLDCCNLLIQQEASMRRQLTDWLDFRYDLRQNADKDLREFHQWVSLEGGPWNGVSLGAFGEPTHAKENSDIGGLVRLKPLSALSLYASRNAVDWNFNSRGSSGELYEKKPLTFEGGIDAWTPAGWFRPRLEVDTPLVRFSPAAGRRYHYRRTTAELRWDLPPAVPNGSGFSLHYRHEYKQEGSRLTPGTLGNSVDFARVVHQGRAAGLIPLDSSSSLEVGAEALWRSARTAPPAASEASVRYLRWEVHPYTRWRKRVTDWGVAEAATFLSYGELRQYRQDGGSLYAKPVEAKLGLGWDFVFSGRGKIGLYSNFDLDDADRHIWDGGNLKAQLVF